MDNASRAGLGLSAALALVLLTLLGWHYLHRPPAPGWNANAITARFADMRVEQGQENIHLHLYYTFFNHTGKPWSMPPPTLGALMRRQSDGDLHDVDSVEWEQVAVPAGKTAEVTFDLLLGPPDANVPLERLHDARALDEFAGRHLRHLQGLVFRDYSTHDSVPLPSGWSPDGTIPETGPS